MPKKERPILKALLTLLPYLLPLVLGAGGGAVVTYQAITPRSEPDPPPATAPAVGVPVSIQTATSTPPSFVAAGWVPDPDAVKATLQTLPNPYFRDTPAGKAVFGDEPKEVFLWQAVEKVTGQPIKVHDQSSVGSCVSFGTSRAAEKSLAVGITQGDRFQFKYLVEEAVYGGSRVEIGGGRIRGDGSVGAWAAKWCTQYGCLPRGTYGTYDLATYSTSRAREWGQRGCPDDLEPEAKKYPAGDAAMVTTWAEAKKALAQGYGIAVCSNQGFTMQRDANGVCRPSGSWAHCMCLDGYCEIDGEEYGHIENSWGPNAHTGPVGPGKPSTAGFWAKASVVGRMLGQQDSFAYSAVKGFPARKINWFVMAPKPVPQPLLRLANAQIDP